MPPSLQSRCTSPTISIRPSYPDSHYHQNFLSTVQLPFLKSYTMRNSPPKYPTSHFPKVFNFTLHAVYLQDWTTLWQGMQLLLCILKVCMNCEYIWKSLLLEYWIMSNPYRFCIHTPICAHRWSALNQRFEPTTFLTMQTCAWTYPIATSILTRWRLVLSILGLGSTGNACYSKIKSSSTG